MRGPARAKGRTTPSGLRPSAARPPAPRARPARSSALQRRLGVDEVRLDDGLGEQARRARPEHRRDDRTPPPRTGRRRPRSRPPAAGSRRCARRGRRARRPPRRRRRGCRSAGPAGARGAASPASTGGGTGVLPNSARAARISASPSACRPWSATAAPCTACSVYAASGGSVSHEPSAALASGGRRAGVAAEQVGVGEHPRRAGRPRRRVPADPGGRGHAPPRAAATMPRRSPRTPASGREHRQALHLQVAEVVLGAPARGPAPAGCGPAATSGAGRVAELGDAAAEAAAAPPSPGRSSPDSLRGPGQGHAAGCPARRRAARRWRAGSSSAGVGRLGPGAPCVVQLGGGRRAAPARRGG